MHEESKQTVVVNGKFKACMNDVSKQLLLTNDLKHAQQVQANSYY